MYAKSAYVYLQMMRDLQLTHPDVYRRFQEGYHVVRRRDRNWAGLSTYLIIEKVLMRNITQVKGYSATSENTVQFRFYFTQHCKWNDNR